MAKRQYAAIDIAKYVAALLVVAVHTFPLSGVSEVLNSYLIHCFGHVAVPFFFTVAGYFFFKKYTGDPETDQYTLQDYLFRLLKLYVIWSVIYLPYKIYDYVAAGSGLSAIISYVRDFFFAGSYYHLWYFPASIIAFILVFYSYQKKGLNFTIKASLAAYAIGYLINIFGPVWETIPGISLLYGLYIRIFTTARNGFFMGPIYVTMGLLMTRTKRLPKRSSMIGFIVSMILLFLEVTVYRLTGILQDLSCMFLTVIPVIYFLVSWLLRVRMPYKPIHRELRNDSTLIYTSHILFAKPLWTLLPDANIVVYFLTIALAQGFATLVLRNKDRLPILENLY
jgi:serine/alanine racemase